MENIKFNFTVNSAEFAMVNTLESYLWKFANEHCIIDAFTSLDDLAYKACAQLMSFVDDGEITAKRVANSILSCEWELA